MFLQGINLKINVSKLLLIETIEKKYLSLNVHDDTHCIVEHCSIYLDSGFFRL